jgi:hypothetical protein
MWSTRHRCAGLSLAEAVFALALLGLVIFVLGDLTRSLGKAHRVSNSKQGTLEILGKVFPEIRRDIRVAERVENPLDEAPSPTLELQHYLEQETVVGPAPRRLEFPVRTSYPRRGLEWDPRAPGYLRAVAYALNGVNLERRAGSEPPQALAQAEDFQVCLVEGLYQIRITVSEDGRRRVLKLEVARL